METAKAPLAAAAQQFAGAAGARLILIGMALSTFGFMTGMMLSTPRTLFALGADGFFPRPLGKVHPQYRTPHVAIIAQGIITCLIALTGTYVKLAILADVAILIVYLACCVGAGQLRRRNVGAEHHPFVMPAGAVVPWLAAAIIIGLLARATLNAWLITGGVVLVASIGFLARRGRAGVQGTMGNSN
jgi:amino acid transporter